MAMGAKDGYYQRWHADFGEGRRPQAEVKVVASPLAGG